MISIEQNFSLLKNRFAVPMKQNRDTGDGMRSNKEKKKQQKFELLATQQLIYKSRIKVDQLLCIISSIWSFTCKPLYTSQEKTGDDDDSP